MEPSSFLQSDPIQAGIPGTVAKYSETLEAGSSLQPPIVAKTSRDAYSMQPSTLLDCKN